MCVIDNPPPDFRTEFEHPGWPEVISIHSHVHTSPNSDTVEQREIKTRFNEETTVALHDFLCRWQSA